MSKPLAVTGDFLLLMNQNQNRLINPKWSVGSTDPPCTDCFYFRLSGLNM